MSAVEIEQKSNKMPPREGVSIAQFLTVADVERSLRFYERVFGGRILSRGDNSGAPGYIQIANTWLLVNPGAVRHLTSNPWRARQPRSSQQHYEYPRCRYSSVL